MPRLTIADLLDEDDLELELVAGQPGANREVSWVHIAEVPDPTEFLQGGELLLATGLGIGDDAASQRLYLRRLAAHGLAGFGYGIGPSGSPPPPALLKEAERLDFPVLTIPWKVPFIAITKLVAVRLTEDRLQLLTGALEFRDTLMRAALEEAGVDVILGSICHRLNCRALLVDSHNNVLGQRYWSAPEPKVVLRLPVRTRETAATLKVGRAREFGEFDLLVLHHAQAALAVELARQGAVSAAELRLAGDLLEDLEQERLDAREAERRLAAFGLDPDRPHAALIVATSDQQSTLRVRDAVSRYLQPRRHLSSVRRTTTTFLVELADESEGFELADEISASQPDVRVSLGPTVRHFELGRSLLEARAALGTHPEKLVSYRDLGALDLLLSLPTSKLRAFASTRLGDLEQHPRLMETLDAFVEADGRWNQAAARLGVHRNTLRYRIDSIRNKLGRSPEDAGPRNELWLALRSLEAVAAKSALLRSDH